MVNLRINSNNGNLHKSIYVQSRQRLSIGNGDGAILYSTNTCRRLQYDLQLGEGGRLGCFIRCRAHDGNSVLGINEYLNFIKYNSYTFRENQKVTILRVVQKQIVRSCR